MSKEGGGQDYQFKWYAPGPENPFGLRILDCRSLTRTVVATTSDLSIAQRYNRRPLRTLHPFRSGKRRILIHDLESIDHGAVFGGTRRGRAYLPGADAE